MPKRELTASPDDASTQKPTRRPTSNSTRRPKTRPTVEPISAPDFSSSPNAVYSLYELLEFEKHHKYHPRYLGDFLGEFVSPFYAKRWLKDQSRYGAFAIVERVNGKIINGWPYENDPPDDDDGGRGGDPRVEVAVLKARLEATRNGAHNPVLEKMAERFLDEKMKDPLDQLTGTAEKYERLQTMFGARQSNPAQTPQQSTDSSDLEMLKAFTPFLSSDDASIRENASDIIGRIVTKYSKDELGFAEVAMEAVKNGQAAQMVQSVFSGLGQLASMILRPAQQNPTQAPQPPQQPAQAPPQSHVAPQAPAQPLPETAQPQAQPTQPDQAQPISPEEQALALVSDHCARNQPVKIAFDRLMAYADAVNEQAPQYSIDGYIEMFATMPTEAALAFVKSRPGGEQVVSLPHAPSWCAQLQRIIKDSGFLDEGAEGNEFAQYEEIGDSNVKL